MNKSLSYNDKMKAIRPYVSFNYDLRKNLNTLKPSDKAEITKYYNFLENKIQNKNYDFYRPRNKKNIKKTADALNLEAPTKKLKALPVKQIIDKNSGIKYKVRIINKKGKKTRIKQTYGESSFTKIFFPIEPIDLMRDAESALKRELKGYYHPRTKYFPFHKGYTAHWAIWGSILPSAAKSIDELILQWENVLWAYNTEGDIKGVYLLYREPATKPRKRKTKKKRK